jgi:hypothetical protein
MVTSVEVMIAEMLSMAKATAPAIIAPPRVVGVSPCRTIIAAAELPGGAVDGMAAAAIVHAARSRVGAAAPHEDSATALIACSTTAHEDTASAASASVKAASASASAASASVKAASASAALRDVNAGATAAEAASARSTAAASSTTAAPRFGNGYSDEEPYTQGDAHHHC